MFSIDMEGLLVNNCSRILDMANTTRLRVVEFKGSEQFQIQSSCPCCANQMAPLCVMVGTIGDSQIRLGACDHCGYLGYMDKPEQQVIADFYNNDWDKVAVKSVEEIRNNYSLIEKGYKASRHNVLKTILSVGLSPADAICEIGSGYGEVLRHLQLNGFSKLFGTEHSPHRAKNVSEAFGINVLWGEFESEKVQTQLKKSGPFRMIYSNHVLEHTFDPNQIIQKAADLQREGDYLVLCMPDVDGENINFALHFIPHLHSFSKESLESLLNRNGYELERDCSFDLFNIVFLAKRKKEKIEKKISSSGNYVKNYLNRIRNGSVLQDSPNKGLYQMFWGHAQGNPDFNVVSESKKWWFKKAISLFKSRVLKRFGNGEIFLYTNDIPRKTNQNCAPFEIQFDGQIKVLMK